MRVFMHIFAYLFPYLGGYTFAQPCEKINHILGGRNTTLEMYPECARFYSGDLPQQKVIVSADPTSGSIMETVAAYNLSYGISVHISLLIHAVGVELYVSI